MRTLLQFLLLLTLSVGANAQVNPDYIRHPTSTCTSAQYLQYTATSGTPATCSQVAYANVTGTPSALPPNGSAGGDLTGTYPNPTIANSAVTNAKLANMAAHTVKANITGSAAAPVDSSLSAILDAEVGSTRGMLLRRGSSAWQSLTLGSSGQVVGSDGTDVKYLSVTGVTAPTGTGFVETTSGAFNAAATTFAAAAVQVSSFNATGLTVPLAASFTTFNGGSGTLTLTDKSDRMQFLLTPNGTAGLAGGYLANIATPYTLDAAFDATVLSSASSSTTTTQLIGIGVGTTVKWRVFYFGHQNSAQIWAVDSWTTSSSNAGVSLGTTAISWTPVFLRITDTGTTRAFLISVNGKDYEPVFSEATNTFVTPTQFVFVVYNGATGSVLSIKGALHNFTITNSILSDAP